MIVVLAVYGIITLTELILIINFAFGFKNPVTAKSQTKISILVCARNEEANLSNCLESLMHSDYDMSLVEVLVGEDNSTDNTWGIVESFSDQFDCIRGIKIKEGKNGLIAKGNVLAQLMDQVKSERILIIDADMRVSKGWLYVMSGLLQEYDLISGYTTIDMPSDPSGVQYFDWSVVLHTMKSTADLSRPISILGNNMGFTRKAYEQVGGFRELGPTDVEDLGLLRVFDKNGFNTFQYLGSEGIAYTQAQRDFNAQLKQRVRWMNGVFTHHWLLAIPALFARLWLLIGGIGLIFSELALLVLLMGILLNYIKFLQVRTKSETKGRFRFISPASISVLDTFALLYRLLIGKVSWKGRRF